MRIPFIRSPMSFVLMVVMVVVTMTLITLFSGGDGVALATTDSPVVNVSQATIIGLGDVTALALSTHGWANFQALPLTPTFVTPAIFYGQIRGPDVDVGGLAVNAVLVTTLMLMVVLALCRVLGYDPWSSLTRNNRRLRRLESRSRYVTRDDKIALGRIALN